MLRHSRCTCHFFQSRRFCHQKPEIFCADPESTDLGFQQTTIRVRTSNQNRSQGTFCAKKEYGSAMVAVDFHAGEPAEMNPRQMNPMTKR